MKKGSSVIAMAYALSAMSSSGFTLGGKTTAEEILSRKRKEKKLIVPNGMKEFEIEGIKILALNEKNAVKKYNKIITSKLN